MKQYFQILLLLVGFLFIPQISAVAFHIVGGELTYECVGDDQYRIDLTVYRDCYSVGAELDNPAHVFVFNSAGQQVMKVDIDLPGKEEIAPPDNICAETLPEVCVERAKYSRVINLEPSTGGYTIVYQRYSRNSTLANINFPDETGSSFVTTIPPSSQATCNSSPVFNSFPPIVVCANQPLVVDQSAFDLDGDSLVYSLCNPLIGGSDFCPQPGSPTNCEPASSPAPPPPYSTVSWSSPYSVNNQIGGTPAMSIDPITGILEGFPDTYGQFVVGICVSEYRNGEIINTINRDFQFNITECVVVDAGIASGNVNSAGNYILTDCGSDYVVDFNNTSIGASDFEWIFPDETASFLAEPSYEFPDTGSYNVILIADSGIGNCKDTAYIEVKIYPNVYSSFDSDEVCAGTPTSFFDTSTTEFGEVNGWTWDFGNEEYSFQQNPQYVFNTGGIHPVKLTITTDLGCIVSTSQEVSVIPRPLPNYDFTQTCIGEPVTFTYTGTGEEAVEWEWNFGDPNSGTDNFSTLESPTHIYNEPGTFSMLLTVTSEVGCKHARSKNITVYPDFQADAGSDTAICFSDSIQLLGSTEYDWFTYQWSPSDGLSSDTIAQPMASPASTTNYSLTISDPNGCEHVDQIELVVHPLPVLDVSGAGTICQGDEITLIGSTSAGVQSFEWTAVDFSNTTDLELNLSPSSSTNYMLTAIDNNGCSSIAEAFIEVIQPVNVELPEIQELCDGDEVILEAIIENADQFSWNTPEGLSSIDEMQPTASPNTNQQYILSASNSCFQDSDTMEVVVNPLPFVDAGPDATVNIGESTFLYGEGASAALWTPALGLDDSTAFIPLATPLQTQVYLLTSTDEKGCIEKDSVTVTVTNFYDLLVPNAFSPNQDGMNDYFRVLVTRGIKEIETIEVFNRWGQLVYQGNEETNNDQGWDGTFRNEQQEMGVYAYYIRTKTYLDEEIIYKGNLTIIR